MHLILAGELAKRLLLFQRIERNPKLEIGAAPLAFLRHNPSTCRLLILTDLYIACGPVSGTNHTSHVVQFLGPIIWYAPVYDSILLLEPYTEYLDACAKELDLQPHQRMLDVGSGTGNLMLFVPTGTVVALDASPRMQWLARWKMVLLRRCGRSRRLVQVRGDASRRLPFADGTFDAVASLSAIHSLPDQAERVRDMARVLAPGGKLVMTVPLDTTTASIVQTHFAQASAGRVLLSLLAVPVLLVVLVFNLLQEHWHRQGRYRFLSQAETVALVEQAGLIVDRAEPCFADTYTLVVARKPT